MFSPTGRIQSMICQFVLIKHVLKFDRYLDDTNNMSIRIKGFQYDQQDTDGQPLEPIAIDADIGYTTDGQRNMIIAYSANCIIYNITTS